MQVFIYVSKTVCVDSYQVGDKYNKINFINVILSTTLYNS